MNLYLKTFEALNLPSTVSRCASGAIKPPTANLVAPADWYGFPPALMPIWSDGSGPIYLGIWKHWFVDRKYSFVKMYVSSGRLVVEVARTAEQLCTLVSMMSICERDGIEDDLLAFAKEVNIRNLDQINNVSLVSGDNAKGLIFIDQFSCTTPLESVPDIEMYSGNFPTGKFDSKNPWWLKCSSFEVPQEIIASWPVDVWMPEWFVNPTLNKIDIFNEYLKTGSLANAWLTLNSTGWTIRDARSAICALNAKANDSQFNLLVEAWLSIAEENAGGY